MCESIGSATGHIAAVTDRGQHYRPLRYPQAGADGQTQFAGIGKAHGTAEKLPLQKRGRPHSGGRRGGEIPPWRRAPILSQGDLMGCVLLLLGENDSPCRKRIRGWSRPLPVFWENRWRTSDDISQNAENVLAAFCCAKA